MKKTNACRILDKHKIEYKVVEYEVDESDLSAVHVATCTGTDVKRVFKTLVCTDEKNQPLVACIQGDAELDLKALAKVAGVKKCTMLPLKDVLKVTGYIRGGCSPFGMKKQFSTFIDEHAFDFESIFVSAGIRGAQIELKPQNVIDILGALRANIIHG
jgi:Cys-tRNA(Pro)/Cys-tRNA(Cys) deacylase